jgi:hypothetical protein
MELVDETRRFCHGSLATATNGPVDRHGRLE